MIFMFCLKSAAYFRAVSYTWSRIRTVMPRSVVVFVRAMKCWATSTVCKITPWQARVTCGNPRGSIGLYLEQYGGSWATRVHTPPLAGARDVRNPPRCDRVILGTVRRMVGPPTLQPQAIGEPLQVCLEQ